MNTFAQTQLITSDPQLISLHKVKNIIDTLHTLNNSMDSMTDIFYLALEYADIGIWDWDIETDKLTWSDKMFELFGVDKSTFNGDYKSFDDCLDPEDKIKVKEAINRCIESNGAIPYEYHFAVINFKPARLIKGKGKLYLKNGKPYKMVGVCIPVSTIKPRIIT